MSQTRTQRSESLFAAGLLSLVLEAAARGPWAVSKNREVGKPMGLQASVSGPLTMGLRGLKGHSGLHPSLLAHPAQVLLTRGRGKEVAFLQGL